jgi:hypothetical protein
MNACLMLLNMRVDACTQWSRWYFDAWANLDADLIRRM